MEFKKVNSKERMYKNTHTIERIVESYKVRQIILWFIDMCSLIVAAMLSMRLMIINPIDRLSAISISMLICMILHTLSFKLFNCYSSLWRYAGEEEMISILLACTIYILPLYLIDNLRGVSYSILFYILYVIFIIAFTGGLRLTYRTGRRIKKRTTVVEDKKVIIIGGGSAGQLVINELKENPQIGKVPVGIIDDDINKLGRKIHGIKILGNTADILDIVDRYNVDEIIIAIASVSNYRKKEIINICKETKCKLKTIPGIFEIIDDKVDIKSIRDVDIEDLLGREPISVDLNGMGSYIKDKVIMVTGGGGSIGSELCRQIARFRPNKLIILDNYENNAYEIQQELIREHENSLNLNIVIASIREEVRLDKIFKRYRPQVVFHAAAHKHVPLMEDSPSEAIKNNIFGTQNVAKLANKYNVKKFVLISTDKAVNPTNIMGATKRAAEMIIQTMNENSETEFVAVRFGNVLGSNGSVIPLFKRQIKEGGPVTITHPDIIRYFMTIPEAVQLVIQAGAMAKGGEIFILDMGEPVKIVDLANNLIKLSGLEPGIDLQIEYTGLRAGEKLYEELLMEQEGIINTDNNMIFIGKPIDIDTDTFNKNLEILEEKVDKEEVEFIEDIMRELVDTYTTSENENVREVETLTVQ